MRGSVLPTATRGGHLSRHGIGGGVQRRKAGRNLRIRGGASHVARQDIGRGGDSPGLLTHEGRPILASGSPVDRPRLQQDAAVGGIVVPGGDRLREGQKLRDEAADASRNGRGAVAVAARSRLLSVAPARRTIVDKFVDNLAGARFDVFVDCGLSQRHAAPRPHATLRARLAPVALPVRQSTGLPLNSP